MVKSYFPKQLIFPSAQSQAKQVLRQTLCYHASSQHLQHHIKLELSTISLHTQPFHLPNRFLFQVSFTPFLRILHSTQSRAFLRKTLLFKVFQALNFRASLQKFALCKVFKASRFQISALQVPFFHSKQFCCLPLFSP